MMLRETLLILAPFSPPTLPLSSNLAEDLPFISFMLFPETEAIAAEEVRGTAIEIACACDFKNFMCPFKNKTGESNYF